MCVCVWRVCIRHHFIPALTHLFTVEPSCSHTQTHTYIKPTVFIIKVENGAVVVLLGERVCVCVCVCVCACVCVCVCVCLVGQSCCGELLGRLHGLADKHWTAVTLKQQDNKTVQHNAAQCSWTAVSCVFVLRQLTHILVAVKRQWPFHFESYNAVSCRRGGWVLFIWCWRRFSCSRVFINSLMQRSHFHK